MKNQTYYKMTPKDSEHPYHMYDAKLWNLPNDELLIMLCILSNKSDWVINRIEIERRFIKGGTSSRRFRVAWMNLQKKGYIKVEKKQGYVIYTIHEDPDMNVKPNLGEKPKKPTLKRNHTEKSQEPKGTPYFERNDLSEEEISKLSDRQKQIYFTNINTKKFHS